MHFAHSRENKDRSSWQDLPSHLRNVGDLAHLLAPTALKEMARTAGL